MVHLRPGLFEADFPLKETPIGWRISPCLMTLGEAAPARSICDFQVKVGPLMVDTFDDLMVYFLEAELIFLAAEIVMDEFVICRTS